MFNSAIGQVFTPDFVAKFMVLNLIKHLKHKANISNYSFNLKNKSVLEPAVGEGVFLKYLLQNGFSDITAYEIDPQLKEKIKKRYPKVTFHFKNVLNSIPKKKYNIVIGNPPYLGQNYNSQVFQDYVSQFPLCKKYFVGNMDLFYFFIHLGIEVLKPGGFLSYITTKYWITKSEKTGIKYLKPHILNECYLIEYIDLSPLNLFENAQGQENCIFVLQKKTEKEKLLNKDRAIDILQIDANRPANKITDLEYNKQVFSELLEDKTSEYLKRYTSATTNNDLEGNKSWNLLYPEEIKRIVNKIERFCMKDEHILYLKDYFFIRNGLIFIKDEIFILKEGENILYEDGLFYLKINNKFVKLTQKEQTRLKKLYKSKSIRKYGYSQNDYIRYALYFNRNKLNRLSNQNLDTYYERNYPNLTKYLNQTKNQLKATLVNAKENENYFYFPRRGDRIKRKKKNGEYKLIYLEEYYENKKKIFLPYITEENLFGYSDQPYFATSDTYFLWPKIPEEDIDYPFLLAYLNSEIVQFLFYAKSIKIKRSKTKLENSLPISNLDHERFRDKENLITLIRFLGEFMMEIHIKPSQLNLEKILSDLKDLKYYNRPSLQKEYKILRNLIINKQKRLIHFYINSLFLKLFNFKRSELKDLLDKYYLT
ncbi:MAG: Eco57I restriction-modification methylase domain-containing protein [Promethearchaeati archaeon]